MFGQSFRSHGAGRKASQPNVLKLGEFSGLGIRNFPFSRPPLGQAREGMPGSNFSGMRIEVSPCQVAIQPSTHFSPARAHATFFPQSLTFWQNSTPFGNFAQRCAGRLQKHIDVTSVEQQADRAKKMEEQRPFSLPNPLQQPKKGIWNSCFIFFIFSSSRPKTFSIIKNVLGQKMKHAQNSLARSALHFHHERQPRHFT